MVGILYWPLCRHMGGFSLLTYVWTCGWIFLYWPMLCVDTWWIFSTDLCVDTWWISLLTMCGHVSGIPTPNQPVYSNHYHLDGPNPSPYLSKTLTPWEKEPAPHHPSPMQLIVKFISTSEKYLSCVLKADLVKFFSLRNLKMAQHGLLIHSPLRLLLGCYICPLCCVSFPFECLWLLC